MENSYALRGAVGVEVAADGVTRVARNATAQRGLLVVGRRLQKERNDARKSGRALRTLNDTERRALLVANDADMR